MLPSTGYFKGINCPFYDSGLCERPYCHFRHVKKEPQNASNDGIESGVILQKLVSAAVQKVLQQSDTSSTSPTPIHSNTESNSSQAFSCKATYNPTPIAELNKINNINEEDNEIVEQKKRHIPVPYTPRKPASLPIKRPADTNGTQLFTYVPPAKYNPGSETPQLDPYTPKGSTESKETYLPGSEKAIPEYTPNETQNSKVNYIPSDRNNSKKKILEYKPIKVKNQQTLVKYQPTPKSLVPCFSSDEDEPDSKKQKLTNDLNGLDDLGPEFDILDQILDEEAKDISNKKSKECKENKQNIETTKSSKVERDEPKKSDKDRTDKSTDQKSRERTKDGSREKLKDKSREESKDRSKEKSKERSREKSKMSSREKSKERSREKSKERSREKSKERSREKSKERSREKSKERSREKSKERSREKSKERSREKSKERSREKSKESSREKSKDSATEKSRKKSSDKSREKNDTQDKSSETSHKSSSKDKSRSKSKEKSDRKSSSTDKSSKHSRSNSTQHKSKSKDGNKGSDHNHHRSHSHSKSHKKREKHKKKRDKSAPRSDSDEDHNYEELIKDELNNLSESDEDAIAEECKRIFEEYVPSEKTNNETEKSETEPEHEEFVVPSKIRISRTIDKNIKILPKTPLKPDFKVNAAQTMAERLAKVREFHAAKNISENVIPPNLISKPETLKPNVISKIRIAHVPYASTLLSAKKVISPVSRSSKSADPSTSTCVQTVKKGTQRLAHVPNEKFIDRPGVLEPLASKIPANIRSTYLNMMIDHCLKIYLLPADAYARAQNEELTTSKKCSTVQIYKNSAVLTISRLKKELQECNGVKKSGDNCSALQKAGSQQAVSKSSNTGSWSIENKNRNNMVDTKQLSGAKLYNNIKKWILTEDQLKENGFPRPHSSGEKGRAIIYGQNKQNPPKGFIRTCCRCKKNYTVDKKGFAAVKEECIYHPNNKYRVRGEARYQCCGQDSSSDGCCIASSHVYEYVDFENLKGYVKTLPPDAVMEDYGIYSLDCEMCYTTHGLDLTRVTVIDSSCKVVYESLIKPLHPIIDYNTRYSGITEEQMSQVRTTLLEVQATLLTMFTSKTILIGHSLESDFKALKLIHDTVIDTSVLFPHKMGPPYKRALRNLSSEYLKKIIQNSVDGHDSAEDATVCMELILYKVKEDLKTR